MTDLISGEQTIEDAMQLIKVFEGFSKKPYKCPAGILTIGWGRTEGVKLGDVTTPTEEQEWLEMRLEKNLVWLRNKLRPILLTSNQEAALLSLVYNIGQGTFLKSSVFRILKNSSTTQLNIAELAAYWKQYKLGGGKVLPGLVRRREAEVALFTTPE
jgi:lysozyme